MLRNLRGSASAKAIKISIKKSFMIGVNVSALQEPVESQDYMAPEHTKIHKIQHWKEARQSFVFYCLEFLTLHYISEEIFAVSGFFKVRIILFY